MPIVQWHCLELALSDTNIARSRRYMFQVHYSLLNKQFLGTLKVKAVHIHMYALGSSSLADFLILFVIVFVHTLSTILALS